MHKEVEMSTEHLHLRGLCTFRCFLARGRYPAVQRQASLIFDPLQSYDARADAAAWLAGGCKAASSMCLHSCRCMDALYQGPGRLHGLKHSISACQIEDLL